MAATVAAIRDGLKTMLQTITVDAATGDKLTAHDTIPPDIHPPCAVVRPERGVPKTLGAQARDRQEYRIQVLLGLASESIAQDLMDVLISSPGPQSIRAALQANANLSIAGVKAIWAGWENYVDFAWNDNVYLSADVLITVEN